MKIKENALNEYKELSEITKQIIELAKRNVLKGLGMTVLIQQALISFAKKDENN